MIKLSTLEYLPPFPSSSFEEDVYLKSILMLILVCRYSESVALYYYEKNEELIP